MVGDDNYNYDNVDTHSDDDDDESERTNDDNDDQSIDRSICGDDVVVGGRRLSVIRRAHVNAVSGRSVASAPQPSATLSLPVSQSVTHSLPVTHSLTHSHSQSL